MASSNIPLLCNICPRKPKFSDVSHLLTHIASKGHLSHYYKVKVRSTHEEESRRIIDAYDLWYAEWNVEELMSDRMNQKDKRRTRTRSAGIILPDLPKSFLDVVLTLLSPQSVQVPLLELNLQLLVLVVVLQSVDFLTHAFQNNKRSKWSQTRALPHLHCIPVLYYATGYLHLTYSTGRQGLVAPRAASPIPITRRRANTLIRQSDQGVTNILPQTHVLSTMTYPVLLMTPWLSAKARS